MAARESRSVPSQDVGALVEALYGLSSIRRELQRLAGIEHAVGAVTALSLLDRTGPARISDVAQGLQVDLSVASRHLHALGEKGFVERIADPEDGRSHLVAISAAGREKFDATHRRLVDGLADALDGWSAAQITTLAEGLVRLQGTLGRQARPEPTSPGPAARGGAGKESSR